MNGFRCDTYEGQQYYNRKDISGANFTIVWCYSGDGGLSASAYYCFMFYCSPCLRRNEEVTILEKLFRWCHVPFLAWQLRSWTKRGLITQCIACLFEFQVVPHITDAIKNWIESVSQIPVDGKEGPADVCVIELGGTVGEKWRDILNSKSLELCFPLFFLN